MVKYLSEKEKLWSRDLWNEAFWEDSQDFVNYYYQEKVKDNRILAECEDERILAMVQMNPYQVRAGQWEWRVDYLVGVATRKEMRHQGRMRKLLLHMMNDMREERMPFCFLMPAAEAIYKPFGFTWVYRQPQWELKPEISLETKPFSWREGGLGGRRYLAELADWMNGWLECRFALHTVRDEEYLLRLCKELISEQGRLELLYDGAQMVGMRAVWGLEKQEQRLLYCEPFYVREKEKAKPAIMARIITPEVMVRAVHLFPDLNLESLKISLHLEDPLIEENQGWWIWHLNKETSWMERDQRQEKDGDTEKYKGREENQAYFAVIDLTITELTGWLFGYEIPEQVKPLERIIEPLQGVFLDEVV